MVQAPNPMPGLNDWLAYQQSIMEKMTAVMTEAGAKTLPDSGLQGQAQAWRAIATGAGPQGDVWPVMPNLMDPALQDKLKQMFAKFGVPLPEGTATMPSVADAMLGRLTQVPTFAHLWDLDQKVVRLTSSWTRLHAANQAYRTLVTKAWASTQQSALRKAGQNAAAAKGPASFDWREGLDDWLSELNAALLNLMRTVEYLNAQKQLLNAGLDVREQLRKLGDEVAEWFQLPGRDEVDDLAKSVADLRRQVRRMTRGHQRGVATAAKAAPAKQAARRTKRKPT